MAKVIRSAQFSFSVRAGWQQSFVMTLDSPRHHWPAQQHQQVVRDEYYTRANEALIDALCRVTVGTSVSNSDSASDEVLTGCSVFRSSSCIDPLKGGVKN